MATLYYHPWIASKFKGEKSAQLSSLDELYSFFKLFLTAPNSGYLRLLISESLPSLRDILRQEGQDVCVYEKTFSLLLEIVQQPPPSHSAIIKSGIVVDLVRWLSPRHSITDEECRKSVFNICELIARKSDEGRQALVDADILPELSHLASSQKAIEVVSACKILKALACSGTFRNTIITAGLEKAMEDITSPISLRNSLLQSMEPKRLAQTYAEEVPETLKLAKRYDSSIASGQAITAPQKRLYPSLATIVNTGRSESEKELPEELPEAEPSLSQNELPGELPEAEPSLSPQSQPNVSQVVTSPAFGNTAFKGPRLASSRPQGYDPLSTSEKSEATGASNNPPGGNMFSGNSCFMGGSYYNVRGNAHFSTLFQVSFGFETLYRNISASAFHDSRARFPPPRCHSSTRKEILAKITDHITETPSSSKILYLFGSEGTGKSAIAQAIAEYCKTISILGASFFFSRESSERNTDRNLIATLAYQLCVAIPELKPLIAKAVEDDLSTFQKDVDTQMERLIVNPIIQATEEGKILRYPILIVIDGLDECEGAKEQCAFLRAINGAIGRYSLPLYFFITSRQEGHIVNWLDEDRTPHRSLDLDQHHIQTKKDIEIYICSEFERIRSVHHIPESVGWPSQINIQMVVSKTNMLFSRASEIMGFIDQKNAPSPETQLEVFLQTSGPSVTSSKPLEVLSGIQVASSAAPNLHHHDGCIEICGRVKVDGLRYRRRPNLKSEAIGQYPIGTKISITGFTQEGTTVVKGDARWARLSNGYWVALANGDYVPWTGSIPQC